MGRLPHEVDVRPDDAPPTETSPIGHGHAGPARTAWPLPSGDGFVLRYDDGTTFVVDRRGCRIWATWPDSLTIEDTAVYLLGPVLAFVLRLRGVTCLHASAVSVADGAIAMAGPSGAGKSTVAAALCSRGYGVVCDDLLALDGRADVVVAHPGCPRLRLWPDSATLLYGSDHALPRLTPNWDKRYLNLITDGYGYEPDARPLIAVYLLGARKNDRRKSRIAPVRASEGLLHLLANAKGQELMIKSARRRDFDTMSRIARLVPLRRILPGSGANSISELCDAIGADLDTVKRKFVRTSAVPCTT